ncbi:MAG: hypothetical protein WC374_13655 [Phycisphaerae bacterium]|jgi:hypothetical protein
MKAGSKEHYELMAMFEKSIKTLPIHGLNDFTRTSSAEKHPANVFYENGTVNNMFLAFQLGYSFRECIANLDR